HGGTAELQRRPRERAKGLAIYSQTALINPQRGPSIKAPTLKSYQPASKTTLHCARCPPPHIKDF
uniref:Uncharacterized protein n=1 Tax=Sinocyclocheilus anshuiensis TaxID=1608454 RepID=A0A671MEA5_9TELE